MYDCNECGNDTRTDLTGYSSGELALQVMNNEDLYVARHSLSREELGARFIFTDEQWDELQQDLECELDVE